MISKLLEDKKSRETYLRAVLNTMIPSQIKALRYQNDWTQEQLAREVGMKQSRISAMEKPGGAAYTVETLIRLGATFRLGLEIRFVPHSQMLDWENRYSQDRFRPFPLERDLDFLEPKNGSELSSALFGVPNASRAGEINPSSCTPVYEMQKQEPTFGELINGSKHTA